MAKQVVYQLLILIIAVVVTTARPQSNAIDSQVLKTLMSRDIMEMQPSINDLHSYYGYQTQQDSDNAPLDKLEFLIGQLKPEYFKISGWDNMIRGPEIKRQVRYRQCYFNPISCFKK